MKPTRPRWSPLVLLLLPLLLACPAAKDTPAASDNSPRRVMAGSETTTETTATAPRPNPRCTDDDAEAVVILVDIDAATKKIKRVVPKRAVVCADQIVTWISSESSVPVQVYWKPLDVQDPGNTPPANLPCASPLAQCGDQAYSSVTKRTIIKYGVKAHAKNASGVLTEVDDHDPMLDILPIVEPSP